jgi:multicomponent Na+:H+ antiporter subunit D
VFWGTPDEQPPSEPRTDRRFGAPLLMIVPTAVLALASIAVSVFAGELYGVSERAATDLLDTDVYVEAVLDTGTQSSDPVEARP